MEVEASSARAAAAPFLSAPDMDVSMATTTSTTDGIGSAMYSNKAWPTSDDAPPPPNPPFVFPAKPAIPTSFTFPPTNRRPHSLTAPASGSKTNSMTERRNSGSQSPIKWSFPARLDPPTGLNSPPQSPPQASARTGPHRRGTSAVVVVDGPPQSPTSPTADTDSTPAATGLAPPRRGRHAHRRSGAISCQDLSILMKPTETAPTVGGSAPTSPLDETSLNTRRSSDSLPSSPRRGEMPSIDSEIARKSRVGFSDHIEFIPRPLSVLSSDTSSTVTILQHNRSLSGSISSLNSGKIAMSPQLESVEGNFLRPSTAGAVLTTDGLADNRGWFGNWLPTSGRRPTSASTSPTSGPSSPVSQSIGGWTKSVLLSRRDGDQDGSLSPISPTSQLTSPASTSSSHLASPPLSPQAVTRDAPQPHERSPLVSQKLAKKHKRVKLWAGSILSKKSKHRIQRRSSLSRRSPTPPLRNSAVFSDAALASISATASEPTLLNFSTPEVRPQMSLPQLHVPSSFSPDYDTFSPIIDLDAALGPFNTPDGDAGSGGFSAAKRRMHSGGRTGGFSGPGLHYHRRTESAPEMAGFEGLGEFGLHRLASMSTMADVFEEDEDAEDSPMSDATSTAESHGLGLQKNGSNHTSPRLLPTFDGPYTTQRGLKRKGSANSDEGGYVLRSSLLSKISTPSLRDEVIPEETFTSMEQEAEVRPWTATSSNMATPALTPSQVSSSMATPKLGLPAPLSPSYMAEDRSSFSGSGYPSPELPYYFDDARVYTATSSFVDDPNFEAMLLSGEPGPEYRVSVDDVPSLTSSHSSAVPAPAFARVAGEERSMSMSSAPASFNHNSLTRKRSSLASFTRLIGSSHGEKSKLSIENRPDEAEEQAAKKEKRWSRMRRLFKT